jgi:hypothetical protein
MNVRRRRIRRESNVFLVGIVCAELGSEEDG